MAINLKDALDKAKKSLDLEAEKSVEDVKDEAEKSVEDVKDEAEKSVEEADKDVQHGKNSNSINDNQSQKSADDGDDVEESKKKAKKSEDDSDEDVEESKKSEDSDDDGEDEDEDKSKKDVQHGKNSNSINDNQAQKSVEDITHEDIKKSVLAVLGSFGEDVNKSLEEDKQEAEKNFATVADLKGVIEALPDMINKSVAKAVKDMNGSQDQSQSADLSAKKAKKPKGETGDSGEANVKVNTNSDVEESGDPKDKGAKKSVEDEAKESVEKSVEPNEDSEKEVIGKSVQGVAPKEEPEADEPESVEKSIDGNNPNMVKESAIDNANFVLDSVAYGRREVQKSLDSQPELSNKLDRLADQARRAKTSNNLELANKSIDVLADLNENNELLKGKLF